MFDIARDPAIGPNNVRHFEQTMQAVAGLDANFRTKLDIAVAVDEYVLAFCLHEPRGISTRRSVFYADFGDDAN